MSVETEPLYDHLHAFIEGWMQSVPGTRERELQRRNCLLGVILIAQEEAKHPGAIVAPQEELTISGLGLVRNDATWRRRTRLMFAAIEPARGIGLPTREELLDSLAQADGRYQHNLQIPIP